MKKYILSLLSAVLFLGPLGAQTGDQVTVSGVVTDASGETLPGAIVTVHRKGADAPVRNAMADIEGVYSITVGGGRIPALPVHGHEGPGCRGKRQNQD